MRVKTSGRERRFSDLEQDTKVRSCSLLKINYRSDVAEIFRERINILAILARKNEKEIERKREKVL